MLKKNADKWVKALTSGKFKQTKGTLCITRDNFEQAKIAGDPTEQVGHCCLGVLAEIHGFKDLTHVYLNKEMQAKTTVKTTEGVITDKNGDSLTINLRIKGETKKFNSLSEANDAGVSFRSIATWITKNYKLL